MWSTIILGAVIACYVVWVVKRKVKRIKAGQFCDCGCGGCDKKCK